MGITIKRSKTADSRSCDFEQVTKEQLFESTAQHIGDVATGINFLIDKLQLIKTFHDASKILEFEDFYRNFKTGFTENDWLLRHYKHCRHHLMRLEGCPEDVNLLDVLEMVVDCVMAAMGREGAVTHPIDIDPEILMRAFNNTIKLLEKEIKVTNA